MINKEKCLNILAKYRTDELVITTMSAAVPWGRISDHDLDYASIDSAMGHAVDFALGIAMALPEQRIMVLNGDGSTVMSLGTLAVITSVSNLPKNLIVFVMENDTYEVTGNQPIPGAGRINFVTIAQGSGFEKAYEFSELKDFEQNLPAILKEDGPILVALKLARDNEPPPRRYAESPVKYLANTIAKDTHRLKELLGRKWPS